MNDDLLSLTATDSGRDTQPACELSLRRLREALLRLRTRLDEGAARRLDAVGNDDPALGLNPSVRNLAQYLEFRSMDLRPLQRLLSTQGLSSLGRCEGHVRDAVGRVLALVERALGEPSSVSLNDDLTLEQGQTLLVRHTLELLGPGSPKRDVRIMVTLPSEAAEDYGLVRSLLAQGMDVARINCAHDGPAQWRAMADNVRRAAAELGRSCRVAADLAGHKVRTGPLAQVEGVLHVQPRRDRYGRVLAPARVHLSPDCPLAREDAHVLGMGVEASLLDRLHEGESVSFVDARGAERRLTIVSRDADGLWANLESSAYIVEGLAWWVARDDGPLEGRFCGIPGQAVDIRLVTGDLLKLTREELPGEAAVLDPRGGVLHPAHIACTCPQVFDALRPGQRVWIDDGKFGAEVLSIDEEGAVLRIGDCRPGGARLLADKGLNFPNMNLDLPALSDKDKADLDYLVGQVDIIGFSFVESGAQMNELLAWLAERQACHMGVIAKIETARAFRNLPGIILAAIGRVPFGLMIARGDLAMEVGPERMAEVQEEMLWLAEAAHLPVVWATQVLETLAKKGVVSRPELTDAAMGERAECVMLNKGPFIEKAVRSLDDILTRMQGHQQKKSSRLRALRWS